MRFLHRVTTNEERHLLSDVLSYGQSCGGELEERYKSDFTTQILEAAEHLDSVCVHREAEKYIKKDQALLLAEASNIDKIIKEIGWRKLWDQALDYGLPVVKSIKNLLITYPDHVTKKYPLCDTKELNLCLPKHFITEHTKSEGTGNTLQFH